MKLHMAIILAHAGRPRQEFSVWLRLNPSNKTTVSEANNAPGLHMGQALKVHYVPGRGSGGELNTCAHYSEFHSHTLMKGG